MKPPPGLSFDSPLRPRKSEAARGLLQGAAFDGTRSQRAWLIMVDGQKSLRELAVPARALGLSDADLLRLVEGGWLEFPRPRGTPAPPLSSPEPVAPEQPRAASDSGPTRSWAAAKMYAIDLVRVLLPAFQRELIEQSRSVTTGDELKAWLQLVAAELTVRAGPERAQLFVDKVRAVMPSAPKDASGLEPP